MSIEQSLGNSNSDCQKSPLVLVVEYRNQANDEQLQREGDDAEQTQGNEAEGKDSLSVVESPVSLQKIVPQSVENY